MTHTQAFCVPVYAAETIQGVWVQDPNDPNLKGRLGVFQVEEPLPSHVSDALTNGTYRRVDNVRTDVGRGIVFEGGAFLMLGDVVAPCEQVSSAGAPTRDWRSPATRFWQCPNCGGILKKEETTLNVVEALAGILGSATCSFCGSSQGAADVYWGVFDFAVSDNFIARMGAEPQFALFDTSARRWRYKGCLVPLKSDRHISHKSAEMDILDCVDRNRRAFQQMPRPIEHRGSLPSKEGKALQALRVDRVTAGERGQAREGGRPAPRSSLRNLWQRLLYAIRQKPPEP